MTNNIEKGKRGELVAKDYLLENGYSIINTNYRNKIGEIDIIAKRDHILIFVEVKTRTSRNYGYPYEAVNRKKQEKIVYCSLLYIQQNKLTNYQLRYDIIEVYLTNKVEINHIDNAFCL